MGLEICLRQHLSSYVCDPKNAGCHSIAVSPLRPYSKLFEVLKDRLAKFTAGFLPHQKQCT